YEFTAGRRVLIGLGAEIDEVRGAAGVVGEDVRVAGGHLDIAAGGDRVRVLEDERARVRDPRARVHHTAVERADAVDRGERARIVESALYDQAAHIGGDHAAVDHPRAR